MVKLKIGDLLRKKEYDDGRDLTLQDLSKATGLSINTWQYLKKGTTGGLQLSTIDTLCKYFGCSVADLIEYIPDGIA